MKKYVYAAMAVLMTSVSSTAFAGKESSKPHVVEQPLLPVVPAAPEDNDTPADQNPNNPGNNTPTPTPQPTPGQSNASASGIGQRLGQPSGATVGAVAVGGTALALGAGLIGAEIGHRKGSKYAAEHIAADVPAAEVKGKGAAGRLGDLLATTKLGEKIAPERARAARTRQMALKAHEAVNKHLGNAERAVEVK